MFSYYIITSILLCNYSYFLSWCYENNLNLLEFTKTISNLHNFYEMIERLYLSKKYLHYVGSYENFLSTLTNSISKKDINGSKKEEYQEKKHLFYTARMTICEL